MCIRSPVATTLLVVLSCVTTVAAETDVQRIARQFREYCLHEATDRGERLLDDVELPKTAVAEAIRHLRGQRDDGSWADVDYSSNARSSWPPYTHLTRTLSVIVHARRPDTPDAERANCVTGVYRAMTYWITHDLQCPNWWYNEIGVPKIVGTIAILLGDDLAPGERAYVTDTVLPRSKVGAMTGQNRVWLAANGVMRGVLRDDAELVRVAANVIQDELRVSAGEGIQRDWSFHQHGPQQQFGTYGLAFAVEMARWATILRDTPFALPPEKLAIVRGYLLEGQSWVTWRGTMDVSACGRQLFPGMPRSKAAVLRGVMRTMALVDSAHSKSYESNDDLVGNRYFWRSDYMIHRRPGVAFSLKMSSSRVIGGETVNNENLSGLLLADGATYVYRDGREYEDIFPVWDWRKIPGVTAAQADGPLRWPKKVDLSKSASLVGGVSDGVNGCAAMDFRADDLRAKKAWIFVGDAVVCLGIDITSTTRTAPLLTTINQCLLRGPVTIRQAGKSSPFKDSFRKFFEAEWVEHDGIRYVFPEHQAITVAAETHTGNWKRVFDTPGTPTADVSKELFTLCVDHRSDNHYAYFIVPSSAGDDLRVTILSNTALIQAAKVNDVTGAVFWTAGQANVDGIALHVDQPCVLIIDSGGRVTVADPTQKLKSIRLTVGTATHDVELPQGEHAGSSVSVDR